MNVPSITNFRQSIITNCLIMCGGLILISPASASAGAWLPRAGATQIIANSYITSGVNSPLNGDVEIYAEHGLTDNFALIMQATASDFRNRNVGGNIVGSIRIPVRTLSNWQSSIQLGAIGAKSDRFRDFDTGVEARLALGRGFSNGYWIDGEFGIRNFRDKNLNFWEAAVGKQLSGGDMVILKGFGDNYLTSVFKTKAQLSYVHDFNSDWAFEIGIRFDFKSYNDAPAQGAIIGLWRRF